MAQVSGEMEEFVAVQILEYRVAPGQAVLRGAETFPERDPLEMCFCLTAVAVGCVQVGGDKYRTLADQCYIAAALLASDVFANSLDGAPCRTLSELCETWGEDDPFFVNNDKTP